MAFSTAAADRAAILRAEAAELAAMIDALAALADWYRRRELLHRTVARIEVRP